MMSKILGLLFIVVGAFFIFSYVYSPFSNLEKINLGDPTIEMQKLYQKKDWQTLELYTHFILSIPFFDSKTQEMALKYNEKAKEIQSSFSYKAKECAKGALTGQVKDIYSLGCTTLSDLTLLGDLRDLGIQAWHFIKSYFTKGQKVEKVDPVIVALSGAGAALTILTLNPELDLGASLLKSFRKVGAMSDRFAQVIVDAVKERKIADLKFIFKDNVYLATEYGKVGLVPLGKMYKYVDDEKELANLTKLTKDLKPATTYVLVTKTDGEIIKGGEILEADKVSNDIVRVEESNGIKKYLMFVSPKFSFLNMAVAFGKDIIERGGWKILATFLKEMLGKYLLLIGSIFIGIGAYFLTRLGA